MLKGQILSNSSNLYQVKVEDKIIECSARGILKQTKLTPVVGDYVEIEIINNNNNEKNKGIITKIYDRKMYCKRPKIANLTQIILVISMKTPKPDFLLLDKQLAYCEYLKVKPIICINKIDLGTKEQIDYIHKIYEKIGYKVIDTNGKEKTGIDKLKEVLEGEITAFSGNSGVRKINAN